MLISLFCSTFNRTAVIFPHPKIGARAANPTGNSQVVDELVNGSAHAHRAEAWPGRWQQTVPQIHSNLLTHFSCTYVC
jgi:hypothetical protein